MTKKLLEAIPCMWNPCELNLKNVVTMPISPLHIKQYPWGEPCSSGILVTFVTQRFDPNKFPFLTILPPRRGLKRQWAECF